MLRRRMGIWFGVILLKSVATITRQRPQRQSHDDALRRRRSDERDHRRPHCGSNAIETFHPIRDLRVALWKLLGLDDNKLTYDHAGRYKQLSQFGGQMIEELIA